MPQKKIHIDSVGEVVLHKRRGNRTLRLSVAHDGQVRVSMPIWTPYHVGQAFVHSKTDWLVGQIAKRQIPLFQVGSQVGKAHRVRIRHEQRSNISARVSDTEIVLHLPVNVSADVDEAQAALKAAAIRALKQEGKRLLPTRLAELAEQHGFNYRSVAIKQLRSRWGSCSSNFDIVLNCYLMQLPWELIDYVLLHELNHTKVMAHGPRFWKELAQHVPDLARKRQSIRAHQPTLMTF